MKSTIDRRRFLCNAISLSAGSMALPLMQFTGKSNTVVESKGFFTVDQRNGPWPLVTPENEYIFSIGINHVDPAAIRFTYSEGLCDSRYGNSMEKWLSKVKQDLTDWGFNCLGWDQEVVIRDSDFLWSVRLDFARGNIIPDDFNFLYSQITSIA